MTPLHPRFIVEGLVLRAGAPWTAAERLVALCVASHMDKAGQSWPANRGIAERTGLCRTTVRLALHALCSGPDAVFERTPGTGREASRYRLIERDATNPPGGRETTLSSDQMTPQTPQGDAKQPPGGRHVYTEQTIEQTIEQTNGLAATDASHPPPPSLPHGNDASAWFTPKPNGRPKRKAKAENKPATLLSTVASPLVDRLPSWSRDACDDWIAGTGGTAPGGRIGKALHPLVTKLGWQAVRPAWADFCSGGESKYGPEHFANHYGEFAGRSLAYVITDEGLPF